MKFVLSSAFSLVLVFLSQKAQSQICAASYNGFYVDTCTLNAAASKIKSTETDMDDLAATVRQYCSSDQEKVYLIYTWIAGQFKYDMSRFEQILKGNVKREMYMSELLKKRKGVCGDFANLFKELCDSVGVPCFRVSGYTKTFRPFHPIRKKRYDHAWNVVSINGNWYPIDVTWGIRQFTDKKMNQDKINYSYLFADAEVFAQDHLPGDPLFQTLDQQLTYKTFRWGKNPKGEVFYDEVQADTLLAKRYKLSEKERAFEAAKEQIRFVPKAQKVAVSRVLDRVNMFTDKKNPANKKITRENYDEAISWYNELINFSDNLSGRYQRRILRYSRYKITELEKLRDKLKE